MKSTFILVLLLIASSIANAESSSGVEPLEVVKQYRERYFDRTVESNYFFTYFSKETRTEFELEIESGERFYSTAFMSFFLDAPVLVRKLERMSEESCKTFDLEQEKSRCILIQGENKKGVFYSVTLRFYFEGNHWKINHVGKGSVRY